MNGRIIKRIMLFGMGDICYDTISAFNMKLKAFFEKRGIASDIIEINGRRGYSLEIKRCLETGDYAAAVSFNSAGEGMIRDPEGINLFDRYNVPFFLFLLDHPMDHYIKIKNGPENMHVICIDRDHPGYVKKIRPDENKIHFMLLGGSGDDEYKAETEDEFLNRRCNLSFTGTRNDLSRIEKEILSMEVPFKMIAADLAELMLSERSLTNDDALVRVLKDHGLENLSDIDFAAMEGMVNKANLYVRAYVREEVVRTLMASDISFDIFGKGWDELKGEAGKNVRIHGSVSYKDTLMINRNSKLMLNVMPWFKNGSHDRIPTAMMSGAAVLTDHSKYLDEVLMPADSEDQKLFFYDISKPEKICSIVSTIFSDKDFLYKTAIRGQKYAIENMTWEKTAEELMKYICME